MTPTHVSELFPERDGEAQGALRLGKRYRADAFDVPVAWNETLDVLVSHRSVRAFLPDANPPGTVEALIAAAQSAASSSNLQPWSVVAVEDPDRRQDSQLSPVIRLISSRRPCSCYGSSIFTGSPVSVKNAVGLSKAYPIWRPSCSDRWIRRSRRKMQWSLESLGLGAVYAGGIRNKPSEVAQELGLPPRVFALVGLRSVILIRMHRRR